MCKTALIMQFAAYTPTVHVPSRTPYLQHLTLIAKCSHTLTDQERLKTQLRTASNLLCLSTHTQYTHGIIQHQPGMRTN